MTMMMYLEDFLEIAEGIPDDFGTKLQEMNRLDEQVELILLLSAKLHVHTHHHQVVN